MEICDILTVKNKIKSAVIYTLLYSLSKEAMKQGFLVTQRNGLFHIYYRTAEGCDILRPLSCGDCWAGLS